MTDNWRPVEGDECLAFGRYARVLAVKRVEIVITRVTVHTQDGLELELPWPCVFLTPPGEQNMWPGYQVRRSFVVVDNFLRDPDAVCDIANQATFVANQASYKGLRSTSRYLWPNLKETFEHLLSVRITDWLMQPYNGVFQRTTAEDPLVWHADTQTWAAAIYLDRLASGEGATSGTSFWEHKATRGRRGPEVESWDPLDGDSFDCVDRVGGVFNRLVLWDAKLLHSASGYPPHPRSRLVQLFFFSTETA